MSLNDSSALILIIGALAVLAFVIHGLWFSGRSINRKLAKNNKEDQEIVKSEGVGKVRIVTAKEPSENTELKLETYGQPVKGQTQANPNNTNQVYQNKNEVNLESSVTQNNAPSLIKENSSLEINVFADPDHPYKGLDIEEICSKFGFLRNSQNMFCVYEDPSAEKPIVVFRICSLERPYKFPENMTDYKTQELALYMKVPQRGKAVPYFKAMCMAADIFVSQLGGIMRDNYEKTLTSEDLEKIEDALRVYDNPEESL